MYQINSILLFFLIHSVFVCCLIRFLLLMDEEEKMGLKKLSIRLVKIKEKIEKYKIKLNSLWNKFRKFTKS